MLDPNYFVGPFMAPWPSEHGSQSSWWLKMGAIFKPQNDFDPTNFGAAMPGFSKYAGAMFMDSCKFP